MGAVYACLVARWYSQADALQLFGAAGHAEAVRRCALELEQFAQELEVETLMLKDAAAESGYSYSALEKMLRAGQLPNAGSKGRPRVRRGDLPRKPPRGTQAASTCPSVAATVLQGRVTGSLAASTRLSHNT